VYRKYPQHELSTTALLNEGWSYFQLQQFDTMVATFRAVVQRYPATKAAADAQFTIADYYYNQKQYNDALVAYQEFLAKFPTNARSDEARQLIAELGEVEAYREYEQALAFFDAKNWRVAIAELTKVLERYPNTSIVYGCKTNIASAYEQLGERRRALELFNEIIRDWKDIEAAKPAVFFAEMHKRWIEAGK
jgi:TolA-binding protein